MVQPSDHRQSLDAAVGCMRCAVFALTREVLLHSGKDNGYCLDPHLFDRSSKFFTIAMHTYIIRKPA